MSDSFEMVYNMKWRRPDNIQQWHDKTKSNRGNLKDKQYQTP